MQYNLRNHIDENTFFSTRTDDENKRGPRAQLPRRTAIPVCSIDLRPEKSARSSGDYGKHTHSTL